MPPETSGMNHESECVDTGVAKVPAVGDADGSVKQPLRAKGLPEAAKAWQGLTAGRKENWSAFTSSPAINRHGGASTVRSAKHRKHKAPGLSRNAAGKYS